MKPPPRRVIKRWFRDRGDETKRLDYPLNQNSVVFDLGGYKGDFANALHSRYGCKVHVFEPVATFCEAIKARFASKDEITVYSFGLSARTRQETLYLAGDGSSTFLENGDPVEIDLVAAEELIKGPIDLMKINIEGGEYELLDHLLERGLTQNIANIQVQFHGAILRFKARRRKIRKGLKKTHRLTYDYPMVWENWRLR